MSADQFRSPDVAAFQLAALLENYEEHVEQLTSTSLDGAVHAQVRRELDEMRIVCVRLPLLSVPWLHVLISHAELVQCLWDFAQPGAKSTPDRSKERHLAAIGELRMLCLRQFDRVEYGH